jgi:branched-chain amino acid transport system permease protein
MLLGLVDTVLQGVLLGGLYALYATGLSVIFGIMRLVNLAHGDLIVLGAFLVLALSSVAGLNVVVAFVITVPIMFALGYGLQSLLLNRSLGRDVLPPLLITFGLSIIVQNGLLELFSADSRRLHVGALETASLPLGGGIAVGVMPLLCFAAAVGVIVALNVLFYRTALGRAFRATSDDVETVQLMGIDDRRIYAVAMGIALAVCAVAGLFLGARANFDPSIGPARLVYAFEAVIIGGLGSLWGTLAGGVVVGVAQTVGAWINPEWQVLGGHLAFLLVLLIRPRGLFPRAVD